MRKVLLVHISSSGCCNTLVTMLNNGDFGFPYCATPAFSTPAVWCRVFQSRVFHPCSLVPRFPVPRFPVPRFQSPRRSSVQLEKSDAIITALHGMQTRSSDKNSVRPSVCPLSNVCIATKRKKDLYRFYTLWKERSFSLSFLRRMVGGGDPFVFFTEFDRLQANYVTMLKIYLKCP